MQFVSQWVSGKSDVALSRGIGCLEYCNRLIKPKGMGPSYSPLAPLIKGLKYGPLGYTRGIYRDPVKGPYQETMQLPEDNRV